MLDDSQQKISRKLLLLCHPTWPPCLLFARVPNAVIGIGSASGVFYLSSVYSFLSNDLRYLK